MKWSPGRDVNSQILFYAASSQALWILQKVTFVDSEKNTKGQTKTPFVPKEILMKSFEEYLPSGMFFPFRTNILYFSRAGEIVLTRKTKEKQPNAIEISGKWFSANLLAWVRQQLGREYDSGTVNQHHVKLRGYTRPIKKKRKARKPRTIPKIPPQQQTNDDDTPYRYAAGGSFTPQGPPIPTSNTFAALSQKTKKKRSRKQRSKSRSTSPKASLASSSSSSSVWKKKKKQKQYHFVCLLLFKN